MMMRTHLHTLQDQISSSETALVNRWGLVQHHPVMKLAYEDHERMILQRIVCLDADGATRGVLPFVRFCHEYGDVIHSLPFLGYGGPVVDEHDQEDTLNRLIIHLVEYATAENILTITLCLPPFTSHSGLIESILQPDYTLQNFFQYIDLKQPFQQSMGGLQRRKRTRNMRIAGQQGIIVTQDHRETSLKYWYEHIYLPRLTKTGGAIYPWQVFKALGKAAEQHRVLIQYAMKEDQMIGGGIYLKQPCSLDNYMRVVSDEGLTMGAGILLDWSSLEYAQNEKYDYYNWQSCDAVGSDIYRYKESWGSQIAYHQYMTKVTGCLETLKEKGLQSIKEAYAGVFVIPFSELK
ncbi:GNAT family N-acetyltransferase [Anoxynatronum sibiricum]|uniref:GNAT family N-acetyltransferase n=2 Tax=Anoxynatronum sibiricum TaxID=210623 RepID=A0ABU9VUD0_9CLOT